jgi:CheY-like chemotaxis protein
MMPVMDGIEAAKIIRGMGYTRPIVALTANAVKGQAEVFIENGFDYYISKPIDSRELNAVLNNLIRDRQPPEVIEAARREKNKKETAATPKTSVREELIKIFIRDASKAIAALETMSLGALHDEEIQNYIVAVHGIKTALANIGEMDLSNIALILEQAAHKKDTDVMSKETPLFLSALRNLVATLKPPDNINEETDTLETSIEDFEYLRRQMLDIKTACRSYNKAAVKKAIADLRQKPFPRRIKDAIDTIAEHLLHSDFEEILPIAEDIISNISS